MSVKTELSIKIYGDEILVKVSEPVEEFGQEFEKIIEEMEQVMYQKKGIGLAAPQVGISKRFFIVNIDGKDGTLIVLANPKIVFSSKDCELMEEGCLSVPGVYANVIRPHSIVIQGQNIKGEPIEITATGLLARAMMHELDHLDGKLFIDRLEDEELKKISSSLKKFKKNGK